ncbi:MAG: hypothetical protein Q8R28_09310 [Dehalococcoidia bacterium]|nr:hypothetical protein [Dehalococcoidia bacterium]
MPKNGASDISILSSTSFTYLLGGWAEFLVVIGELKNVSGQYRDPGMIQIIFLPTA